MPKPSVAPFFLFYTQWHLPFSGVTSCQLIELYLFVLVKLILTSNSRLQHENVKCYSDFDFATEKYSLDFSLFLLFFFILVYNWAETNDYFHYWLMFLKCKNNCKKNAHKYFPEPKIMTLNWSFCPTNSTLSIDSSFTIINNKKNSKSLYLRS